MRLLLYPQWSLYPQILPLEVGEDEISRPLRELIASRIDLPSELLDVFDGETLEDRAATPVAEMADDARLGLSFGRTVEGSPFPRSGSLFHIGQGPVESHRPLPPEKPPAGAGASALREGILLRDEEERLRHSLLTRGYSDDLDRLATLDFTSLLPYRRPGDPPARVVFRLSAHLDENNLSDLDLLSDWLDRTRERAGESRIRIPYRIELELDLLVDYRKTRLARWLELAIPAGERLLGMDRDLERPGFLGGHLDRAAVFVYLDDPGTESPGSRKSRAQCIETVARVGSLLSAHPEMADALRRTLSAFVTDHTEPLRRRGPLGDTCAFTWRSVCFLPDSRRELACLARKELSCRLLDLYDGEHPAIDRQGEREAEALLGSVGLLPPATASRPVSFSFDPSSFHAALLGRLPVRVGLRGAGEIGGLSPGAFGREVAPGLRSWLDDPRGETGAVSIGAPETRAQSLERVVLAQLSAFRSAVYEMYDRLVEEGNPRLARAALFAIDRLLGLSAEASGEVSEGSEEDSEPAPSQTVAEYLDRRSETGVEDSIALAETRELCEALGRGGFWSFLRDLFFRDRAFRVRRLFDLVRGLAAREKSREAAEAVRRSIVFGSPFSLAWHLGRRVDADCADQRRSIELLARDAEREWARLKQGLAESEQDRLDAQAKMVSRILRAEHGGLDLERKLRSWLEELLSRDAGSDRATRVQHGHEVLSRRGAELLAEIPPALLERRAVDPVSELVAFEDRVLGSRSFNLGYLREHIDPSAETEHRSLAVFVPDTIDPKGLAVLEDHVGEVAFKFRAGAAVVQVAGLSESVAILDWIGCPVTAFAPREVWEGLLSSSSDSARLEVEETGS